MKGITLNPKMYFVVTTGQFVHGKMCKDVPCNGVGAVRHRSQGELTSTYFCGQVLNGSLPVFSSDGQEGSGFVDIIRKFVSNPIFNKGTFTLARLPYDAA